MMVCCLQRVLVGAAEFFSIGLSIGSKAPNIDTFGGAGEAPTSLESRGAVEEKELAMTAPLLFLHLALFNGANACPPTPPTGKNDILGRLCTARCTAEDFRGIVEGATQEPGKLVETECHTWGVDSLNSCAVNRITG